MSLQLSMVMRDVEAAGIMIIGVLEPVDTHTHTNLHFTQRTNPLAAAVSKQQHKSLTKQGYLDFRVQDTNDTLTAKPRRHFC